MDFIFLSMLGFAHQNHLRALVPEWTTFLNYNFVKFIEHYLDGSFFYFIL